jgi:hypothetical protein
MIDEPNRDTAEKLIAYGQWLDQAAHQYLREKEAGVSVGHLTSSRLSHRSARLLVGLAAALLLVVGSFVVNQAGNGSGGRNVAFAWSANPTDASDAQRKALTDACTQAKPGIAQPSDTAVAVDIRGSLGIGVYVAGATVTLCAAELNRDLPSAQILDGVDIPGFGQQNVVTDVPGVQVANMHVAGHEITIVWGKDTQLPSDCRNLDVFTSKGIIRALRAKGIFAFWYPGASQFSGMNQNSIKYGCAPDAGPSDVNNSKEASIAGADPFANLCIATISTLIDHGIIDHAAHVVAIDKWDMDLYDVYMKQLTPLAEPMRGTSTFDAFIAVNGGQMLALDKSGAQVLSAKERVNVQNQTAIAINTFVTLCDQARTRPEDRVNVGPTTTLVIREMNPATETTVQMHEMNPVVPTTLLPG